MFMSSILTDPFVNQSMSKNSIFFLTCKAHSRYVAAYFFFQTIARSQQLPYYHNYRFAPCRVMKGIREEKQTCMKNDQRCDSVM